MTLKTFLPKKFILNRASCLVKYAVWGKLFNGAGMDRFWVKKEVPILSILLTKIEGRKKLGVVVKESVSVGTNSRIDEVRKEHLEGVGEVLVISFGLDTEYEPDVGRVSLEGVIYYGGEMSKIAEISSKKLVLKDQTLKDVHQAILRIPILVSVNTARELGLPMPISLPRVEVRSAPQGGSVGGARGAA